MDGRLSSEWVELRLVLRRFQLPRILNWFFFPAMFRPNNLFFVWMVVTEEKYWTDCPFSSITTALEWTLCIGKESILFIWIMTYDSQYLRINPALVPTVRKKVPIPLTGGLTLSLTLRSFLLPRFSRFSEGVRFQSEWAHHFLLGAAEVPGDSTASNSDRVGTLNTEATQPTPPCMHSKSNLDSRHDIWALLSPSLRARELLPLVSFADWEGRARRKTWFKDLILSITEQTHFPSYTLTNSVVLSWIHNFGSSLTWSRVWASAS